MEKHFNENGTSDIDSDLTARSPSSSSPISVLDIAGPQYLINVTVGEEYAYCRTCPREKCRAEKRYEFGAEVILQCVTERSGTGNATWWSETIDFCYVRNSDFWESPEGDCEY
jgi:hypothetical protein